MSAYNVTQEQAIQRIRDREEFKAGYLSGERTTYLNYTSYHSAQEREVLRAVTTCDYVVKSYETAIAWHDADGWHTLERTFSPTTSSYHQPVVRKALYGGFNWHTQEQEHGVDETIDVVSENAYITEAQKRALRQMQSYGTLCFSGVKPTKEDKLFKRMLNKLVEVGYVSNESTPAIPDVYKLTAQGARAYC